LNHYLTAPPPSFISFFWVVGLKEEIPVFYRNAATKMKYQNRVNADFKLAYTFL
jgi:hypothetical protein